MSDSSSYQSPLSSRYASKEMSHLFSSLYKHQLWRKLWISLAKAERAVGLPITGAQIAAMERECHNIDFAKAESYEKSFRHDVMAHIHTFADACPEAKGIIHLGATSAFVTDNSELIQMYEALALLHSKGLKVLSQLASFAKAHAALATLSYTHLQSAQPTTVGKRACLWLQDFLFDMQEIQERREAFRFLGLKGATGTQASFLSLLGGDEKMVGILEKLLAKEMGFSKLFTITGQTYPRKQDMHLLATLSSLAASAHKFANDIRLLAHMKEIEEPFAETQVGSSAMPYKRNPMLCERICSLARFLISLSENPAYTASLQWLERSLDDSANRRLAIPEAFLTADALLELLLKVTKDLCVYPRMIEKHLREEMPFLATENILMAAVGKGKDRQAVHERLRQLAIESTNSQKLEGKVPTLLEEIAKDPLIGLSSQELEKILESKQFTGCAKSQVHHFLQEEVAPYLAQFPATSHTSQVQK